MCVNKRREPTTATQLTRRRVRKLNFRPHDETWRVVRALREIATAIPAADVRSDAFGSADRLAGIFRQWESS
jgi:hypothetical protein